MYKKRMIRIIQDLLTVGLWGYFIKSLFYIDKALLVKISGVAVICLGVIGAWRIYNFKRFGKLHRRQFPLDTTIEDVSEFFRIEPSTIENIHNSKMVVLEKNVLNKTEKMEELKEKEIEDVMDNDIELKKDQPEYYRRKLQELITMAKENGLEIELGSNNILFSKYVKTSASVEV